MTKIGLKYQSKRIKIYEEALQIPANVSNQALPSLLGVLEISPFNGNPLQILAIQKGSMEPIPPTPVAVEPQPYKGNGTDSFGSLLPGSSPYNTSECFLRIIPMDANFQATVRNSLSWSAWISIDARVVGMNELAHAQLAHDPQRHLFVSFFNII